MPPRAVRRVLVCAVAVLALVVLLVPLGAAHTISNGARAAAGHATASETANFAGTVLWNGAATASATSPSSAIQTSFGQVATVTFSWSWTGSGAPPFGVSNNRLHVLFFGVSVFTKDQAFQPAKSAATGSYALTSDLTSSRYLLEGIFLLDAQIISDAGKIVWSETFYVLVTEPYHLVAANIGLAALAIYEVVQLVRVGPHALPKGTLKTKVESEPAPVERQ